MCVRSYSPRTFQSPIHWSKQERKALQYTPLDIMVSAQEKNYKSTFEALSQAMSPSSPLSNWTYMDFLWGCECARSRAFSGTYSGSAFNPVPYALTLFLVAIYVGLNLGTIEQAANGATLVLCASIFRDFVFPKLFKTKQYVICPVLDMANHVGSREEANVAFEYFANTYSLASSTVRNIENEDEVRISYGSKSNESLLQNYGFVEIDNPRDVYVMPPFREWNIDALEMACGRTFLPGRLSKLEKAGLLGSNIAAGAVVEEDDFDEIAWNRSGAVVITRGEGIDPAIITALRVLVSTDKEWEASGQSVGNFVTENSGGTENERVVKIVQKKALQLELESKETTLEEDEALLNEKLSGFEEIAVRFRLEKKKLLRDTIQDLKFS